ncbi:unnamed protein product [Pseudo-nitzschia multistriata]|uniref:Peroxisomal membrane protein MPV17 n=1 Tax=Pseudo-nitzschia multistriata TaxID=183589 RepID=A0A448Z103_9STRA|nr:unnamed protein product [Pseudo-nitzschia multistriata]
MVQSTMLFTALGACLLPGGVRAFGMESVLPVAHDLHTHLPVAIHQASSAFPALGTSLPSGIIDASAHAAPSVGNAASSSMLASVESPTAIGDLASSLLSDYRKALDAEPLKVKIITGCLLAIVGDAIAQSNTPEEYNTLRAGAFVAFDGVWRTVQQVTYGPIIQTCNGQFSLGLLGSLPFLHDKLQTEDTTFLLGAIEQTLVSQLVLIPLLYYPIFYSVTGFVQSLTIEQTIQRAKDTFITLMKRNLLFWIPVQFGAFYFVEENLQIPVLTACGLLWTVILSVSAGSVSTSSEEEGVLDGATVEEKMISEGVAVDTGASSFFSRLNPAARGGTDAAEPSTATTSAKNSKTLS